MAVFGILYSLTRTSEGRRDLWSTEDGLFPAPRFGERYSLPRNRFEVLLRCLSFCPPSETKGNDKWAPVRRLIDGFNERRVQKIYPGWQLCIDESVSSWRGKDGDFCSDGMPHVTRIDRKPKGVGCEIKNCADADTKVMLHLKYKKERRSCVLENMLLTTSLQELRKYFASPSPGMGVGGPLDSAFASVTTALACRKHGLHFTGLVKTATKFYPKGYMDEVEFAELGDDITLTTTVDGHNIMAHAWGDKVRKCFVSTHSTILFLEDLSSNKRRWREVLDEDGEEIGQSEVFNKTVKRNKVVETYFDAASIIDINNHMRQGGVALEAAWQTQSLASRVISTILGIVETDAYLLDKKFHPGGSKISHSDFTESVAKGLLIRRIPGASTSNSESLPHDIVPLSSLTYYNKNSPYAAATYANRLCTICKSPCKYLCRVCSNTSKGSIVAMCGLKSKNGSSCITKHILNTLQ